MHVFWVVNMCVFIALWSTKMTSAIWLAVSKLLEFTVSWKKLKYTYAYIVFLFVTTKNNNFLKEIRHVLRAFIAWWKPRQRSALKFSQTFALVFSRLWKRGDHALFLNWKQRKKVIPSLSFFCQLKWITSFQSSI